jgi:PST family polysaccharide transporter
MTRVFDRRYLNALTSLYGAQAANALVPLLLLPYLARVLHAQAWGMVLIAQAFGAWGGILIDYGFNLSATRSLARAADAGERAAIVSAVLGAKALIALLLMPAALAAYFFVGGLHDQPAYLAAGIVLALLQGFDLMWYFQGIERPGPYARLVGLSRLLMLPATVLLVRAPGDGLVALVVQAVAMLALLLLGLATLVRALPLRLPAMAAVRQELARGWSMFVFRSFASLYTTANTVILGLFAGPLIVGVYGSAEKITRQGLSLLSPVAQASFPRISRLVHHDHGAAVQHARTSLLIMSAVGLAACIAVWAGAPLIVALLLGPGYEAVVPVMRILAPMVPLVAISNVLGIQWMVPLGLDGLFNRVIIAGGLLNLALAALLAPRLGAGGMAIAVVSAEALVTAAMVLTIQRAGHAIWGAQAPVLADKTVA